MGGNLVIKAKERLSIQKVIAFSSCFNFSCELGKRLFAKFDKLAEKINIRDDVKLSYVDCDADSEFCDSNGVKGKQKKVVFALNFGLFTNDRKCIYSWVLCFDFVQKPL